VLAAINKDTLAESAFPGQDIAFLAAVGDQELDARAIPHDPDRSRALLAEAGYPDGFGLRLLFPQEDEQLAAVAEIATADLDQVALGVKPVPVLAAEMDAFIDEFVGAGEPTLWLTRP
jgi:ABC-type transport system substrate-binding protein